MASFAGAGLLAFIGARHVIEEVLGMVVADELERVGDALDEIVLLDRGHARSFAGGMRIRPMDFSIAPQRPRGASAWPNFIMRCKHFNISDGARQCDFQANTPVFNLDQQKTISSQQSFCGAQNFDARLCTVPIRYSRPLAIAHERQRLRGHAPPALSPARIDRTTFGRPREPTPPWHWRRRSQVEVGGRPTSDRFPPRFGLRPGKNSRCTLRL